MKKLLTIAAVALLGVLSLSACTNAPKETNKGTENMEGKKILVAYFSWSGNTREAAKYIAQKLNADEFEIIREKPYSTEYTPCTEDAKAEKEAGDRPAIKGKVENMAQYDVVIVAVPVWWYTAPMPVFTFLEQYDLKGKTIIPFCTAYTAEYETLNDIVKATPDSDHRDGICIVTKEMGGKGMDKKHGEIDHWLTKIGF
jgi:flavodoxin